MPTFDTPEPITVQLEISVGDVRLVAGERADTIVEIRPSRESKRDDVTAAEQTRVEYAGGRLLVKAPKRWKRYSPFGDGGSIDVRIELPAGSTLTGEAGVAALHAVGRLGDCRVATGAGDIALERVGALHARTGVGDIVVDTAVGLSELFVGSGALRVGMIEGAAVVKNSNGDCWVGEVTGDLRASTANGDIAIGRAHATVVAKTANGDVSLGEVTRGSIVAETGNGALEIGVGEGVAAWLDLHTSYGNVRSELEAAGAPGSDDGAVEVRARTGCGDITVRRA